MPHMHKLSNYKTTWATDGKTGTVTYTHTEIVRWDADTITLKTGGWDSVTTRRKMNQTANQFGLEYGVYCRDFTSYVETSAGVFPLGDVTVINRKTGKVS